MLEQLPTHPYLLHPLTGEPLTALGLRRNGQPLWPILGAADDDSDDSGDDDTDTGDDDGQDDTDGSDQLGDAGKKALDRMKARIKSERQKRQQLERELADAKKVGDQQDTDKIREQIRTEERAAALRERVLDKIEAKAGGKFTDPEDAAVHLSGQIDDFIDNGRIDTDAIVEALDELLDRKKYLAAQGGTGSDGKRALKPDRGQGARGADSKPTVAAGAARYAERHNKQPST